MEQPLHGVPEITSFRGLPYSDEREQFEVHCTACRRCAMAKRHGLPCVSYCPEGHDQLHNVEDLVILTRESSLWN